MMKILLADDAAEFRNYLRSLLEEMLDCVEIREGENGQEAIDLAQQFHPVLVLMDISMPKVNGIEATRAIHRLMPDCKILILTVHTDSAFVTLSRQAGASGYLLKNQVDQELMVAVENVMRDEWFESTTT
ncbi:MAG: DNA-binding response regulator [Candidatus Omnitrophota bacterium]|jgi:DNA-binding NarL/FixJ family response regulator|nr:MAG: DNA-binding response regulator [Candidatus Omnitrophota bacterium]